MIPLTNEYKRQKDFFKWREDVLKKMPMSKLEKSMEKFFIDNKINYHRQFPIRLGRKRHTKRYAVSFWCSKHHLIFDLYNEGDDMSRYVNRRITILFKPHNPKVTIIPIPADMLWRDVKRDLKRFFNV